jgi:hypothetical protein
MWGFKVLMGKREDLIWGFRQKGKERNLWCLEVVLIVPVNNTTRNRRRKERIKEKSR